eukprot:GHVU01175797.1.p2 GENE.GHVU01175797.1~~GHVU01175797.1.p2  ORF type:complete len:102 (-),score=32.87 GHVU01175797.1:113-418(-)
MTYTRRHVTLSHDSPTRPTDGLTDPPSGPVAAPEVLAAVAAAAAAVAAAAAADDDDDDDEAECLFFDLGNSAAAAAAAFMFKLFVESAAAGRAPLQSSNNI